MGAPLPSMYLALLSLSAFLLWLSPLRGVEMKIDGGAVQQSNGLPSNSDFVFYTYNETAL